ncbi:MAG: gamma-glutamyl-gamma-aminobutyrate hydrolase family protein [Chloroflexota bacterium]
MNPIIGITTNARNDKWVTLPYYDHYFVVPDVYVDAVRQAGGIPILLPPDEPNLEHLLQLLDSLIISGGGDICPQFYDGDIAHPNLTRQDEARDKFEIAIIKQAMQAKDKPIFCVCRGMQVLNVALGGTMYEHIPDIREQDIHRGSDGFWAIHDVLVEPNSKLADAMNTTQVKTYSGHHQAVKIVADGLSVVAKSPDDIVEGLEAIDHPWLVGVQWHPEKSASVDETQQALFNQLVAEARKVKSVNS